MRYEIVLAPEAVEDLAKLTARWRTIIRHALEQHLRHGPAQESQSRIKRLRGISHPQYRLRVDDIRVFYDINDDTVEILAIVAKSDAASWLESLGKQDERDSTN